MEFIGWLVGLLILGFVVVCVVGTVLLLRLLWRAGHFRDR